MVKVKKIHVIFKATSVTTKYFKYISKLDYLLYNVDEFYVLIIREKYNYKQYLIDDRIGVIDSSIVQRKDNKMLRRAFEKTLSPCNFLYFEKDSIERFGHYPFTHERSQLNYFVLKKAGVKYIEYCIPPLFMENDSKKSWYPIDKKLRFYLFEKYGWWLLSKSKVDEPK